MVLGMKKLARIGLGNTIGFLFTLQNIKLAMIIFDKTCKHLDNLEEKGRIGKWNSGKKFSMIKRINSKIVSRF